jgi:hypothetical protein
MKSRNVFTKIFALTGVILVWIPLIFTVLTAITGSIVNRKFLFDYLMPAELSPLALAGTILLLLASTLAHAYRKPVRLGAVAAVLFLIGSQTLAVVTGLASGTAEPTGWVFVSVIVLINLYSISTVGLGAIGILLNKVVYRKVRI